MNEAIKLYEESKAVIYAPPLCCGGQSNSVVSPATNQSHDKLTFHIDQSLCLAVLSSWVILNSCDIIDKKSRVGINTKQGCILIRAKKAINYLSPLHLPSNR